MSQSTQFSGAKQKLLEKFLKGEASRQSWAGAIERRAAGESTPVGPNQQHVHLHSQIYPDAPVYNESVTLHYHGPVNLDALERAFNEFVRRHESWRTAFAPVDDTVIQVVYEDWKITLAYSDLSRLTESLRETEMIRIATEDTVRKFDLSVGPLIRPRLFKMDETYYRLHVAVHHIVMDGVSIERVFLPELSALYDAFEKGNPSPLPEPALQYGDYAVWQARMLAAGTAEKQLDYWRSVLTPPIPVIDLPGEQTPPASISVRGEVEAFEVPLDMRESLKAFARTEGATFYMVLLAAFKSILYRYSGQDDLLVGGVTDSRKRPEFEKLMGYFLNAIVLRTHPRPDMTFREYLAQVKDTVLGALAHSDVPFDQVARSMHSRRDSGRHLLFQVLFSMAAPQATNTKWELRQMDLSTGVSKLDLVLHLEDRLHALTGRFYFNTDLFDRGMVRRFIAHWLEFMRAVLANPDARLSDVTFLSPQEVHALSVEPNTTSRPVPREPVHELFEAQARRTPNATAIECDGTWLTYAELNRESNRLANRLVEAGVQPETLVGLAVNRSCDMVVALLAVLKAGGAYLPIDPSLPVERRRLLIEDAGIKIILTSRSVGQVPDLPISSVRSPGRSETIVYCDEAAGTDQNLNVRVDPANLAYVLYTSGSTGRPKGVEIPHAALSNFLHSMQREPGLNKGLNQRDTLLAVTTLSFDIAALEIFLPLVTGAKLVIATRDEARDPETLADVIGKSKATVMQATPATWRALIDAGWKGCGHLKILCGGEAMPRDLASDLLERSGELWNMYGPTETTIWSTIHNVTKADGPVAIGHPIDNTQVLVLDARQNLATIGQAGELYIGGQGLARGYRNHPNLTEERFVTIDGAKFYRTGDKARWRSDGTLECLGRADNQLKIRGFRVEPEEIEAALLTHPGVRAAAVKGFKDASGNINLAAYVVAPDQLDWRAYLEAKLPAYMVPSRYVAIDALPMTPNQKVDRKALPEPSAQTHGSRVATEETERRLTALFESVLHVTGVGIDDNFFDLGGHSLLAANLARKIEKEFGVRFTLGAVFDAPSVSKLAATLRQENPSLMAPRVVPIQSKGHKAPIFWVNGGVMFRNLAANLGPGRPFIGLSLDPAEKDAMRENCTLEEIARHLTRSLLAEHPRGPYHLAGFCASGVLAYEVAVQLQAMGHEVQTLILLESMEPEYYRRRLARSTGLFRASVRHHARKMASMSLWGASKYLVHKLANRVNSSGDMKEFDRKLFPAALRYTPRPFHGTLTVIQAENRPAIADLETAWKHVPVKKLVVESVGGDFYVHRSTHDEPHVAGLAACIDRCLAHAEGLGQTPPVRVGKVRKNLGG